MHENAAFGREGISHELGVCVDMCVREYGIEKKERKGPALYEGGEEEKKREHSRFAGKRKRVVKGERLGLSPVLYKKPMKDVKSKLCLRRTQRAQKLFRYEDEQLA